MEIEIKDEAFEVVKEIIDVLVKNSKLYEILREFFGPALVLKRRGKYIVFDIFGSKLFTADTIYDVLDKYKCPNCGRYHVKFIDEEMNEYLPSELKNLESL